MNELPPLFPRQLPLKRMGRREWKENKNPAMRLLGKRFFVDQRAMELLVEFLGVLLTREKWIGHSGRRTGTVDWAKESVLPPLSLLRSWPENQALCYRLPVHLNVKLLAFFRRTPPDKQHAVHEQQYIRLRQELKERLGSRDRVGTARADVLEQLLAGLQGSGAGRLWSARTFYPLAPALLMQETIFNITKTKSKEKKDGELSWEDTIEKLNEYYSVSKHRFLARGGEVLYLQLCNLFRTSPEEFGAWLGRWQDVLEVRPEEADLEQLHSGLNRYLPELAGGALGRLLQHLVDYIENLDPETRQKVAEKVGTLECEYCAADTWPETYLFAVELYRLLQADLDPVQRLDMLMLLCALQVLRTICAQSARYGGRGERPAPQNPLGYTWLFTPGRASPALRLAAAGHLEVLQTMIYTALRHPALENYVQRAVMELKGGAGAETLKKEAGKLWKEADDKYGYKLLLSLGKQVGIIAPRTGRGARFVLEERLLRLLVLTILPPGYSCTYPEFLQRVYAHYGIALEGVQLQEALRFAGRFAGTDFILPEREWPVTMLRAAGFLVELSDAFSLVKNTFGSTS
ncbi:MAG: hypothetical protein ACUVTU_08285 [Desulfurispora sp.]|uniref:hypothetical protein n=1 Tax=Desulfurispora sp. TaxID=3014275 RepID=UPI00404B9E99